MHNKLKELIASLEKAQVDSDETTKKLALIAILRKTKKTATDNWATEKVFEIVCVLPSLMQEKNRAFKHFCLSLKPKGKIKLQELSHKLFFHETITAHKNKPKFRR